MVALVVLAAPFAIYEFIKWWLPIITVLTLIVKAYKTAKMSVATFCNNLLNNHLAHIEAATTSTELETRKTNSLLGDAAQRDNIISQRVEETRVELAEYNNKHTTVWSGVTKTLALLEDRTSPRRRPRKRLK